MSALRKNSELQFQETLTAESSLAEKAGTLGQAVYKTTSGYMIFPFSEAAGSPSVDTVEEKNTPEYFSRTASLKREVSINSSAEIDSQLYGREIPKLEPESRFLAIKKWEGVVEQINGDQIIARTIALPRENSKYEQIEFSVSEVSEADVELLAEGAVFYWFIGYDEFSYGQRQRSSKFVFRRLPAWSKRELDEAEAHATDFSSIFSKE